MREHMCFTINCDLITPSFILCHYRQVSWQINALCYLISRGSENKNTLIQLYIMEVNVSMRTRSCKMRIHNTFLLLPQSHCVSFCAPAFSLRQCNLLCMHNFLCIIIDGKAFLKKTWLSAAIKNTTNIITKKLIIHPPISSYSYNQDKDFQFKWRTLVLKNNLSYTLQATLCPPQKNSPKI